MKRTVLEALASILIATVITFGLAVVAYGQDHPPVVQFPDEFEMRDGPVEGTANLWYKNGDSQTRNMTLNRNGVVVDVEILQTAGPERIIVTPHNEDLYAVPSEADVMDGEEITIYIGPPLS